MYREFYALKERPFHITSDPHFFFLSRKHKEALSHLTYGVTHRKGIIVLTGEIGTGKTTLVRFFLNNLDKNVKTAFILNPHFSDIQLLEAIVRDFGIRIRNQRTHFSFISELNIFLIKQFSHRHNVVLIIDEAQNLKPDQLEQVRLLSNLETVKDKLIQIVLVGQPELNQRLNLYELRQLAQRVMVRFHITALQQDEVKAYIEHRLRLAGSKGKIQFSLKAYEQIYLFSQGTPRLINMLCDRALLAAFAVDSYHIDEEIIKRCVEELTYHYAGEMV